MLLLGDSLFTHSDILFYYAKKPGFLEKSLILLREINRETRFLVLSRESLIYIISLYADEKADPNLTH